MAIILIVRQQILQQQEMEAMAAWVNFQAW
jgi:hypothetical protein